MTWQPTPVKIGETQTFTVEGSRILETRPFSILIGLCSRACLSPGLADQGSDTQDSTWILVQHFRGTSKKNQKRKRAQGVEVPSPWGVWGGNGRALTGSKGPYLLSGEILIPGLNRPVQSPAVNWATAGLLVDHRSAVLAGVAEEGGGQRPQGGSSRRPHRGGVQTPACPRFGRRLCIHHGCK